MEPVEEYKVMMSALPAAGTMPSSRSRPARTAVIEKNRAPGHAAADTAQTSFPASFLSLAQHDRSELDALTALFNDR